MHRVVQENLVGAVVLAVNGELNVGDDFAEDLEHTVKLLGTLVEAERVLELETGRQAFGGDFGAAQFALMIKERRVR